MDIDISKLPQIITVGKLQWKLDPKQYGEQFDYVPVNRAVKAPWHGSFRMAVTNGPYGAQLSTQEIENKAVAHIGRAISSAEWERRIK